MVAHPVPALLATLAIATVMTLHAPARAAEDPAGLVKLLDADADGRLSQAEIRMTALVSNFAMIDANGDGMLDRRELRAIGVRVPPRHATGAP